MEANRVARGFDKVQVPDVTYRTPDKLSDWCAAQVAVVTFGAVTCSNGSGSVRYTTGQARACRGR